MKTVQLIKSYKDKDGEDKHIAFPCPHSKHLAQVSKVLAVQHHAVTEV